MWEFAYGVVCAIQVFGGCAQMTPDGTTHHGYFPSKIECEIEVEAIMRKAVSDVPEMDSATFVIVCKRPANAT